MRVAKKVGWAEGQADHKAVGYAVATEASAKSKGAWEPGGTLGIVPI